MYFGGKGWVKIFADATERPRYAAGGGPGDFQGNGTSWNGLMIDFGQAEVTGIFGSGPGDVWAVLKRDTRKLSYSEGD